MKDKQKTIKGESTIKGVGLHTGKEVVMTFKPAKENTGYVFVRTDLEGSPEIKADVNYVTTTDRGTTLEKNGVRIVTCEHVLAALTAIDVDNCYIEMNNAEPPILDGSSKYFLEALEQCDVVEQEADRKYFVVKNIITHQDPGTGSEITVIPSDKYEVTTMVDFGTKVLGTQNAVLEDLKDFKTEIAPARTFSFLHELEFLLDNGLIKGGDLNNAIVYVDKEISPDIEEKLKIAFGKEKVSIKPNGILDNLTLHYPNEAARHKLLDVIGDLALVGVRIKGKIIATKPGHKINTQFGKKLSKQYKIQQRNKIPEIDLTKKPALDINQIKDILPHRSPFLLIDKIVEIGEDYIIGLKNITINEPFFNGHFPSEPVMPGVLQIEAMAQTGGVLTLRSLVDGKSEDYSTYFVKIDNVRFKHKVVPGDTLIFKVELLSPLRRGMVQMQGYGYVGNKIVVEAQMMAAITKNTEKN